MHAPKDILKEYWGHDTFRPGQESIVNAVLAGKDTLALLPTGGGKSICFQVPALCMEGLCVVISPLLALMYDQVENLKRRGLKAAAVTSAQGYRETERTMSDAVHGRLQFLYVSPERLRNETFIDRLKHMPVRLIAVDEAHCISQWGYDFRPPYLEIAAIRPLHPEVPIIALTATATPDVVADIQDKLLFRERNVITSSFSRKNLSYIVMKEEDKHGKILEICKRVKGTGIVYCSTRQRTREMAQWLVQQGVRATSYHAGLSTEEKEKAYHQWLKNEIRIICATNAFGMGIDKPDVRFVVHADVPGDPESYFQEAGRAGRDTHAAYAVLLYHPSDIDRIVQQVETRFPPKEFIQKVYHSLCEHYRIAIGSGKDTTHLFDLTGFALKYHLRPTETLYAIKLLDSSGYLSLSESAFLPSRIIFTTNRHGLYNFQVTNPAMDPFIKLLLRMYGGLFEQYTTIREEEISKQSGLNMQEVKGKLEMLVQYNLADYEPRTDQPRLTFLLGRSRSTHIVLPEGVYEIRKKRDMERAQAMIQYLTLNECRSQQLLNYFGETEAEPCGVCDVCRDRKKNTQAVSSEEIESALENLLQIGPVRLNEIQTKLPQYPKDKLIEIVRWRIDQGYLSLNDNGELCKIPSE